MTTRTGTGPDNIARLARDLVAAANGSESKFNALLRHIGRLGAPAPSRTTVAAVAAHASFETDTVAAESACITLLSCAGASPAEVGEGAHAVRALSWDGRDGSGRPLTEDAARLWHALVLWRLDPEVHIEVLGGLPLDGPAAATFTARYREQFIRQAHRYDGLIWLAEARREADRLKERLHILLDDLASERMHRFPSDLQHLFELTDSLATRVSPNAHRAPKLMVTSPAKDWRAELEVSLVASACERLAAGADPELERRRTPVDKSSFDAFRRELRKTIDGTNSEILQLASSRIETARAVAYEKFLSGDTLYKPLREYELLRDVERQATDVGLQASVARDIALLLLTHSRMAQEGVFDDLAVRLGRNRVFLPSKTADDEQGEIERSGVPLVASPSPQLLLREHQIVDERRIAGARATRVALTADRQLNIPIAILDHMLAGSRGLSRGTNRTDTEALVVLRPGLLFHVGQAHVFRTLSAFQRAGYETVVALDDVGVAPPTEKWWGAFRDFCRLSGVDASTVRLQFASAELGTLLGGDALAGVGLDDLIASFALPLQTPVSVILRTVSRLACLLADSSAGYRRRLIIGTLDVDGDVALARHMPSGRARPDLSALYLRAAKSLVPTTVSEFATAGSDRYVISIDDPPASVAAKMRQAETGGRSSAKEQRAVGGNPDPRFCSVSATLAAIDADGHIAEVLRDCRSGERLCGECKDDASERVIQWLGSAPLRGDATPNQ